MRKLRTSESLARAKETLPTLTPEMYSFLKQVEWTEKGRREGARGREMERKHWSRGEEGRAERVRERREKPQGGKGATTRAGSALSLPL